MENIELQLGKVHSINPDGSINIKDFKTGGLIYTNIDIEHTAASQQQPVVGQHVLFMTVPSSFASSRLAKIIRFYGSRDADTELVRASPVDLGQGELRLVSQKGNTIYVANGAIYLSGLGQNILMLDDPRITKINTGIFQLVTTDGTLIQEKDGILTISKGALGMSADGVTMEISDPQVSVTINKDDINVSGKSTTVTVDCKEIKLAGTIPVARKGDQIVIDGSTTSVTAPNIITTLAALQTFMSSVATSGPAGVQAAAVAFGVSNPLAATSLTGKITQGSSKVKSG
jgi:hypothetical protein